MPIKQRKPINSSSRFQTHLTFEEITESAPEKSLTRGKHSTGGRNNRGHLTSWWRGGGHKRRYRLIDFKRDKHGVPAKVATIEYDPNRSARIALLHYADGEKRYILWPDGLQVGAQVMSGEGAEVNVGNALPLQAHPAGHGDPQHRAARSARAARWCARAGAGAQLMARDGGWAQVKLPSGEVRRVHVDCYATIGQVGNLEHENVSIGKAGRNRWLGWKPHNRGVTMNPVDHPMGGGEGQTSGGRHPTTPWGVPTKGYKTRNNKRTDRHDRPPAEPEVGAAERMARSLKKGYFIDDPPAGEGGGDERSRRQAGDQDLVAPLDGHPRDGRPHDRGAQRGEVHPGLRQREHGRPQAGRVRDDPHLPRAQRQEGREGGQAPVTEP